MKSLYSIHDSFLNEFLPPFVAKNATMAQLSYEKYLEEHPLYKNQKTKLFCVGSYDENLGNLTGFDCPLLIKVYEDKEAKENG